MSGSFGSIRSRCLISVAILLLSGLTYAPDEARASCGDYLTHYRMAHDQTGDVMPASHDASSERKPACEGPHCSNHRDTPPEGPAPSTREVRVERWCVVAAPPIPETSGAGYGVTGASETPDDGFRSGVFRPPRLAHSCAS